MASLLFGSSQYLDELYNELYWEGVESFEREAEEAEEERVRALFREVDAEVIDEEEEEEDE